MNISQSAIGISDSRFIPSEEHSINIPKGSQGYYFVEVDPLSRTLFSQSGPLPTARIIPVSILVEVDRIITSELGDAKKNNIQARSPSPTATWKEKGSQSQQQIIRRIISAIAGGERKAELKEQRKQSVGSATRSPTARRRTEEPSAREQAIRRILQPSPTAYNNI